jgi:ABC-type spermidine/putrescine transport system permease subunit II
MATPARYRLSAGALIAVTVLLAIPIAALVIVPIYARKSPELWGFPFFYWYQLLWELICGLFTWAAHLVIQRDRRTIRRDRAEVQR